MIAVCLVGAILWFALADPGFGSRTTVYLPIAVRSIMGTNPSTDSAILRPAIAADRIDVELKSPQPCLLVLADIQTEAIIQSTPVTQLSRIVSHTLRGTSFPIASCFGLVSTFRSDDFHEF